jgi:hypothetical protein
MALQIFKKWWAYMSSAALTILSVAASIWGKSSSWSVKATGALAIAFLILAVLKTIAELKKENAALKLASERSKPRFQAEIDSVVRNVLNEGHFFVHVHMVNVNDGSASIRRVSLKNHTTEELFPSLRFDRCFLLRNGEKRLSATLTEDGTLTTKESRSKDEVADLWESLKLPLTKGDGKAGWLLFQKAYSLQGTESPSLSLQIEDAFGGIHDGNTVDGPYEYGSFLK